MDDDVTLPLPSSLLLLLTRDDDGRLEVDAGTLDAALAGAVLAELALHGHVVLDEETVVASPEADGPPAPVVAPALAEIAAEPRHRGPEAWVSRLSGPTLRTAVADDLVARGLLERRERKVLGLFRTTSWPEADGGPEARLRTRLAEVLAGRAQPTAGSAALVGLLEVTGVLEDQFGDVTEESLARVTGGQWASPAVRAVLEEIAVVLLVATTVAVTTSTVTS